MLQNRLETDTSKSAGFKWFKVTSTSLRLTLLENALELFLKYIVPKKSLDMAECFVE